MTDTHAFVIPHLKRIINDGEHADQLEAIRLLLAIKINLDDEPIVIERRGPGRPRKE